MAYWNIQKMKGVNPDNIPFHYMPGKVGIQTAKIKKIEIQGQKRMVPLERGRGLMEAITVELTSQWAKSMESKLDIPAYKEEREVLHAICHKIAEEDHVNVHDVFSWFVKGYYSPEGYRTMVQNLSGYTNMNQQEKTKRPHYFQIILGLMSLDEVIATSNQEQCNYTITLQYI